MTLDCAVCIYIDRPVSATTVVYGAAVCTDHYAELMEAGPGGFPDVVTVAMEKADA